jgi:AraC family transcriptional regulator
MARSFKTYLGVTPSQIKECQTVESYSALMRNSKIGSILRKNRYELPDGLSYSEFKLNQSGKVEMKTENHPQRTIAYVRVVGPYGENYEPAVQKLYLWAGAKGVTGECLFIYHDNPDITPADKCRTDIALVVPDDIEPSNGIEVTTVPAGSYAVLRKTVEEKPQYGQFWNQLIEETVAQGIELDERPCFELYHSYDQQTGRADVSFCEAIKV